MSRVPEIEVDGRGLRLSNLDKVLYPQAGFTKAEVVDYYARIAPVLVPHLRDRALTLVRYPDGVEAEGFFEKRCPPHHPDWVRVAEGTAIASCVCDDRATLVWLANLAALELHVPMARLADPAHPTALVLDLDPGAPAGILECAEIALVLRDLLDAQGHAAVVKTSGGKGLQVYARLDGSLDAEAAKAYARAIAQVLERDRPQAVVSSMTKERRRGRVFIDWGQNDDAKTTIAVYSLRAQPTPRVSTPLAWDEVEHALRARAADALAFAPDAVLGRVERDGDLFAALA